MEHLSLGLVGYGKIAQDQHLPAILGNPAFQLNAVATLGQPCPRVDNFRSLDALLQQGPAIAAVSFCTPPQGRYAQVRQALLAGKHVLVEKPPCASLGEAMALVELARAQGVTCLFAWHSRFAPAVAPARQWLEGKALRSVAITWKEDVRTWHPGQAWIWQAGGKGCSTRVSMRCRSSPPCSRGRCSSPPLNCRCRPTTRRLLPRACR